SSLPNVKATLFPGLLAPLLALAALLIVSRAARETPADAPTADSSTRKRWLYALDALCVVAGSFAVVAAGLSKSQIGFFRGATTSRALLVFTIALVARLCLSYPQVL